eukprot:gene4441-4488_t
MVPPHSQITQGSNPDAVPHASAPLALGDAIAAALAWWRDAGVDGDFSDDPRNWLEQAAPRKAAGARAPAAPAAPPLIGGGPAAWPAEIGAFATWWMTEPALAAAGAQRVPPAGPPAPRVMIVVAMPEAQDGETLLSGPAGRLLDGLLAAGGLSRGEVYCTAALPARIAAPDWQGLAEAGLGALLTHHIGLVRPERLILFGQSGISTLLGNSSAHKAPHLHSINHDGAIIPGLFAYDLESILAKPGLKSGLWSRWLDLMPA